MRRSPTMAGNSGTDSLLHNFHQGRNGGKDGWKFQINSALRIRCSKNCPSFALACLAMFVSRSYGSLCKNTTCSRYSPRLTSALVATSVSRTTLLSGVGIYPTPLDTTITIEASSACTLRTGGSCRLNA